MRRIETLQPSGSRRWRKPRPRVTLSDAAVWTFYFFITAVGLMALCLLLVIIWPES